jgi:ABC-type nitrate/sulfonate/bicarbonate transport system permease component
MLLVLGRGTLAVLAVVSIVVLFPALVNLVLGMRQASPQALDLIRVNGGSELTALIKVRVPAALPNVFAAVRISLPGSVVGAMLGEWLNGAHTGLGGIFAYYKGQQNLTGPWVVVAISVILSLVLYAVGTIIETVVLAKWGPNAGRA